MKKFLTLVLALVMALSLVACGGDKNKDNGGTDADAPANKISNNLVFPPAATAARTSLWAA